MVSRIRFWSFKGTGEGGARADRVPFVALLVVAVAIAIAFIDLPRVLFAVGVVYALSGPGYWLWQRMRRSEARAS
jgi:CDP-diacylglycerol--serine O-phosphatidyltransferase